MSTARATAAAMAITPYHQCPEKAGGEDRPEGEGRGGGEGKGRVMGRLGGKGGD